MPMGDFYTHGLSPLARGTLMTPTCGLYAHRFIPAGAGNTLYRAFLIASTTVYPRWRGEHDPRHFSFKIVAGLSPLARGTPQPGSPPLCKERFIPAGAGNTPRASRASTVISVYPRWRGEHFEITAADSAASGLSPLARGTRFFTSQSLIRLRFIPAGAGNTS